MVEMVIDAALFQELLMIALFDDAPVFDHYDTIGVDHGGEAVSDDEGGTRLHQA